MNGYDNSIVDENAAPGERNTHVVICLKLISQD